MPTDRKLLLRLSLTLASINYFQTQSANARLKKEESQAKKELGGGGNGVELKQNYFPVVEGTHTFTRTRTRETERSVVGLPLSGRQRSRKA